MTMRSIPSAALTLGLLLAAAGCVSGEGEPATGGAQIFPGVPTATTDYEPGMAGADAPIAGQAGLPAAPGAGAPAAGAPAAPSGTAGASGAAGGAAGAAGAAGAIEPSGTAGTAGAAGEAGATEPAAGMGGAAGEPVTTPVAGEGGGTTSPTEPVATGAAGTLTIQFTSLDQRGRYAPRNYGAVWIETGSGSFVKTLERWGGIHIADLRAWNAASGGWGFFGIGGNAADQMDVISSATMRTHQAHSLTWGMLDTAKAVVPDGAYKVAVEIADGSNGVTRIDFQKGSTPDEVSVANQVTVSNFTLTYQP